MPDNTEDGATKPEAELPPRRDSPALPVLREGNRTKFARALRILGTDADALSRLPRITPYIQSVLKLRREDVVGYLAMSSDPDAVAWMAQHERSDLSNSMRIILPYEAYCIAAGISTHRLLECLSVQIIAAGAMHSAVTAARHHPEVVEATIGYALTEDGIQDRITLHRATGFLPSPKGSQTTIQIQQNAAATAQAASATFAEPPRPEQTIKRLVDRFNADKGESAPMPELVEASAQETVPRVMPTAAQAHVPVPVILSPNASSREFARQFNAHEED